jgi:hypothetical protein
MDGLCCAEYYPVVFKGDSSDNTFELRGQRFVATGYRDIVGLYLP